MGGGARLSRFAFLQDGEGTYVTELTGSPDGDIYWKATATTVVIESSSFDRERGTFNTKYRELFILWCTHIIHQRDFRDKGILFYSMLTSPMPNYFPQ